MRFAPAIVAAAALLAARGARAAPAADVVIAWAPGYAAAPVADAARKAGAAFVDATPAAPTAAPPDTAAVLRRAIDAYDALRFDDAWQLLEAARAAADRTGADGLSPDELSDLFLYRWLVRVQRGDAPGAPTAWDEILAAATVAPARVLDPRRFPPKVTAELARATAALAAQPRAVLALDAPPRCAIFVDAAPASAAPLVAGEHYARVACADRAPWGARIAVAAPSTRVAPPLPAPAPPSDDEALVQARTAGARAFVLAEVRGNVAVARLIGLDGRERDRRSVTVAGDLAPLAAAVRDLLAPRPVARATHWYQSRWAWAAGAALVAAAILVPVTAALAVDRTPTSAHVEIHTP